MPKQRPLFDHSRYMALKAQGFSQRAIAKEMSIPEATLRDNLKVIAQSHAEGLLMECQGIPPLESSKAHQGMRDVSQEGPPEGDHGTPPLYVHRGIPDACEESPVGGEDIESVHEGIPTLPLVGIHEGDQGGPSETLSPELVEALTTAWPDLQYMLGWWRDRQRYAQEPPGKLERVTYHVAPKWIEAVKFEADKNQESYAAVVNRAFAAYFGERST